MSVFESMEMRRLLSAGDLDPSFSGGSVLTDVPEGLDAIHDIALQPDGKIVAVGASSGRFALARYKPNGTLDPSFGEEGIVTTDLDGFGPGASGEAFSVVIQNDKIIVGGYAHDEDTGNEDFALARYDETGELDFSFGEEGFVFTNLGGNERINAIAQQADGAIVAVGGDGVELDIVRYVDGTPDTSFNGTGIVQKQIGDGGNLFAVVAMDDGRILAGGSTTHGASGDDMLLVRLTATGQADNTLDSTGQAIFEFESRDDVIRAVAIRPDGKIFAAGRFDGNFALLRVSAAGAPDDSFGDHGVTIAEFGGHEDTAFAISVQSDNRIVLAGSGGPGPGSMAVVRFTSTGDFDDTFGQNGLATVNFGGEGAQAFAMELQPGNGRILAAGTSQDEFAMARILPNNLPVDIAPPTAALVAGEPSAGTRSFAFNVIYADNTGVNPLSFDDADVVVRTPNGFDQAARFENSTPTQQGGFRVTYRVDAPSEFWSEGDEGTYTVVSNEEQVADTSQNFLPSVVIGSFTFDIVTDNVDPEAAASPGDVTIGGATFYTFVVTYTDNTAISFATLDDQDVVVEGPDGFSATATLIGATPSGNAASIAATYRISPPGGTWNFADNGRYDIVVQESEVTDTGALAVNEGVVGHVDVNISTDETPPTAALNAPDLNETAATYTFTVTYSDNIAINAETVDSNDLLITGADNFEAVAVFDSVTPAGNGASRTATYHVGAPGGLWDPSDSAIYNIRLLPGQVTDTAGNPVENLTLGTFTIDISPVRFAGGVLSIDGSDGNDTVSLVTAGPSLILTLNGNDQTFALKKVKSIRWRGFDGDDVIDLHETPAPSTLDGGDGNDRITGGAGKDVIIGGLGDDIMAGGGGKDTVTYAGRNAALSLSMDAKANDGQSGEHDNIGSGIETLIGGNGNDVLAGNRSANRLVGGAGNDILRGGDGNDVLVGGLGADRLLGGTGNDQLLARDGARDIVNGNEGNDRARTDAIDSKRGIEGVLA